MTNLEIRHFRLCLTLLFGIELYYCKMVNDPFLLPFGPKVGDMFNVREEYCSKKPFPLDIQLSFGSETFEYAHTCKG